MNQSRVHLVLSLRFLASSRCENGKQPHHGMEAKRGQSIPAVSYPNEHRKIISADSTNAFHLARILVRLAKLERSRSEG
jgi:hypothetical protein